MLLMRAKVDDAIEGIKNPMSYIHMKHLRQMLRIVSGWPGKELGEKTMKFEGLHSYYNTILSLIYLSSGIAYLVKHMKELSFFEIGHMYLVLLLNMLSSSRACTLATSKKYRAVTKQFIEELHLFFHKDKSEYAKKIHARMHYISHYFTLIYSYMMLVALILFNMTPVLNNYKAGKYSTTGTLVNATYEHAIYFIYPFNSDSNFNGYLAASAVNWYGSYLCCTSICAFDILLSLMVFTIYGHLKILIHLLDSIEVPASVQESRERHGNNSICADLYTEAEQRIVAGKLKECINYHRDLVEFIDKISDAFGFSLLTYYTFHQVSGCLLLLECSQMTGEALVRYLPLTIMMFEQLIQTSIIFESIGAMSEKLKDAAYCLPWEYMNTGNRRTVFIFLINVQTPIHVTAAGLVNVGVTTMTSILKTSLSYFTFLRTVSG